MQATLGTKTTVWAMLGATIATAVAQWINPDIITTLLGSWAAPYAVPIVLGINWLLHSLTGNVPAGVAPGTPANLGASPSISMQN